MTEFLENLDLTEYLPGAVAWATNILLAALILIIGFWIAGRVYKAVHAIGKKYEKLDDTLFRFFGSIARYVILAFVFIAVLGRFGVETTSIVALIGAAGLAVGLALQGAMSNLAAGVMLLIFRPYKVDEFIEAAGQFGKVTEIDSDGVEALKTIYRNAISWNKPFSIIGYGCKEIYDELRLNAVA